MVRLRRSHLLLLLLLTASCEKEVPDYRMEFTGDFLFTTVVHNWYLSTDSTGLIRVDSYDTSEFAGFIRKHEPGDDDIDLYTEVNSQYDSLDRDSMIFIRFGEGLALTTLLEPDGRFAPRGAHHYYSTGKFSHPDSLFFSLEGLGGLGAGWDYYVSGSRK